jgi:hypothetical protein
MASQVSDSFKFMWGNMRKFNFGQKVVSNVTQLEGIVIGYSVTSGIYTVVYEADKIMMFHNEDIGYLTYFSYEDQLEEI